MIKKNLNSLESQITNKFGEIIYTFRLLYNGWDQDSLGYIIRNNDKNKLILTNHSKPYEADASELRRKVIEYHEAIGETNSALELLEKYKL